MICSHCEKGVDECSCHHPPKTVQSNKADPEAKRLIEELSPWPLSNEEAWAIAEKHLGYQRTVIKHQDRLVQELMRRNEGARRFLNAITLRHAVRDDDLIGKILRGEERYGEEVEGS